MRMRDGGSFRCVRLLTQLNNGVYSYNGAVILSSDSPPNQVMHVANSYYAVVAVALGVSAY